MLLQRLLQHLRRVIAAHDAAAEALQQYQADATVEHFLVHAHEFERLRRVTRVDPAAADPDTGALSEKGTEYAVGAIPLAGRVVADVPLGTVRRVQGPLRAAEVVGGLYDDGWSGFETVYRRFSGPRRAGTVTISISREGWHGRDKPARVTADSAPFGGTPFAERMTTIHREQRRSLRVPVPPPPFQVVVHVGPTFSPAELGGGADTRQLGAVLGFRYDVTR